MDALKHVRGLVLDCCVIAAGSAWVAVVMTRTPAAAFVWAGAGVIAGPAMLALVRTRSAPLFAAIAAWGVFLPAWALYARHEGHPWSARVTAALVVPAAVLTCAVLGPALSWAGAERDAEESRRQRREARRLGRWGDLLGRYAGEGAVTAVAEERVRSGRSVTLELSGRVTIETLRQVAPNLAVALRLKPSGVTFTPGPHAGIAVMHLDEVDILAEDVPFPEEGGPRSVNEHLPLGWWPDGRPLAEDLADYGIFVTGVTGGGKSVLLNVLIATLSRCEDAVVWVIDTKSPDASRLAAPWIRPWVEGRAGSPGAPAIDWVATTRTEACLMLTCLLAVIKDRTGSLRGGSKLRPSPETPAIYVIIDEVGDLTAPQGVTEEGPAPAVFSGLLTEITRKQRSEACPPVIATQRGTTDFMGRTAIKANCRLRIHLAVSDRHEARSVTDDPAIAALMAGAEHAGTVVIERPGRRLPVLARIFRLDSSFAEDAEKIDRLAASVGSSRCAVDARAFAVMGGEGGTYDTRWERSAMYQQMLGEYHGRTGRAPIEPEPGGEVRQAVAELDVNSAFGEIMAAEGMGPGKDSGGPRARYWSLLTEYSEKMPTMGVGASVLVSRVHAETGTARGTVYRWLREDAAAGKLRRLGDPDNDRRARYVIPPVTPGDAAV